MLAIKQETTREIGDAAPEAPTNGSAGAARVSIEPPTKNPPSAEAPPAATTPSPTKDRSMNASTDTPETAFSASTASPLTPAAKAGSPRAQAGSEDGEEDLPPSSLSQIGLSQADAEETLQKLSKHGQLNEVIGSQSLLSQEIKVLQEEEEGAGLPETEGTQDFFPQTESSLSMAQRYGLLTQEDGIPSNLNSPGKSGHSRSGFMMSPPRGFAFSDSQLSHVSLEEATAVQSLQMVSASQSPPRDYAGRGHEGFGSLLDAVKIITDQEGVDPTVYALGDEKKEATSKFSLEPNGTSGKSDSGAPKRKSPPSASLSRPSSSEKPVKKARKSNARKKDEEYQKAQETAKRAAALAEQTVADPEMAKRLLLSMALVRENPRSAPAALPTRGSVVKEGFFWAHYPPLEAVLKKHMETYYELSTTKCQSAQQQKFNNDLVILIREVAKEQEWIFDDCFNDKSLRDRIRCYYKTHIQNAKKRLRTMVRNPTKKANARHLCAHLDLIQEHNEMKLSEAKPLGAAAAPSATRAPMVLPITPAPKSAAAGRSSNGNDSDSTLSETEVRQIIARKKQGKVESVVSV